MKKLRSKKQKGQKKAGTRPAAAATSVPGSSRRAFLRKARNLAIGVGLAGSGGLVIGQMVVSTTEAHDLTRVGNGRPTVVQIHDPQCPLCRALQKETKGALRTIDDDLLDYVIADIKTARGAEFAARYGVQHVTLLLFDGKGELKDVLQGQRDREELRRAFERLVTG